MLVLPPKDRLLIDKSALYDYYFLWGNDHEETGIVLGFGSLYNHDYAPNAIYETYYEDKIMKVIAIKKSSEGIGAKDESKDYTGSGKPQY